MRIKLLVAFCSILVCPVFAQPEITMLMDYRNNTYDSLNVVQEKKFNFRGHRKVLVHIRNFNDEGFIVAHQFFNEARGLKRRKTMKIQYDYTANRDTVRELHLFRNGFKWDTSSLVVSTFNDSGKLLVKVRTYNDINEYFEYMYDTIGNCVSERRSRPLVSTSTIRYDYVYDSLNRMKRYTRTNSAGYRTEEELVYEGENLVERSKDSNAFVEAFCYDTSGLLRSRAFRYERDYLENTSATRIAECLEGSERYSYNKDGLIGLIKYNCTEYTNSEYTGIYLDTKVFVYTDLLLVEEVLKTFLGITKREQKKRQGLKYYYKVKN